MNNRPLFPIIRHFSYLLTPVILKTPLSANGVTTISLTLGILSLYFMTYPSWQYNIIGSILFFVSYVLDNCDGEVARARSQSSEFGRKYDTFVDWLINSAIFIALGINASQLFNQDLWFWVGVAGFAGGTINYLIGIYLDQEETNRETVYKEEASSPQTPTEYFSFFIRELSRADFCFIIIALSLLDILWILLPAGAVGAQVYWILQFVKNARKFRV